MDVRLGLDASHDFVERAAGGIFNWPMGSGQTTQDAVEYDAHFNGLGLNRIRCSSFSVD